MQGAVLYGPRDVRCRVVDQRRAMNVKFHYGRNLWRIK